jgi:ferrochelatase
VKKGVLVMAYGSPDKTEDIEPYYIDIRRGMRPSPEQLQELTGRYNAIGGSPLLRITTEQANNLQNELGEAYSVFVGMRHWKPWILDAVQHMKQEEIEEMVGIVMAPHYSSLSIEKYIGKAEEANEQLNASMKTRYIKQWHNHPLFIEALNRKITKALEHFTEKEKEGLHIIFTAHSLPERILLENDPYKDQLIETCNLISKKSNLKNWTFAFQSAGRTQEKWLGPDLLSVMDELHKNGSKAILVCSVGFITDHLEVLYDIDIEGKVHAEKLGVHLERTESLNADPLLAKLFAELIREKFDEK